MDAPALLLTKLHPPSVPAQAIARRRLFERLASGRGLRLSLVACPAGFGKSTLLAAWAEREHRPVAWVSLDGGDDDPVTLWAHIVEALCRACPELPREQLAGLVIAAPLEEVVLPRLVNALVETPELVLVLDDFHRLGNPKARASVAWFADHLPSTVQLVVSSRTDPALPLGTLRAHGQLLELRADELRFTVEEAGEFLDGRLGLGLGEEDVEALVARTEGWPAGIYLAALSLAAAEDRHALVRAFDGTSAHVVDFLSAEVLAASAPETREFMLRASVLERLCAPLCDAVLEREGSAAALESLARTNLFLIPLDERREWFRFHHLFAQLLRAELERREPEAIVPLHRRAFAWHAGSGTTGEAIHHALAAGAHDEAGELIAGAWVHYVNAGRASSVLDWLARLPAERFDADPRLLLVQAWIAALRGREEEMRAAVARVRAHGGLEQGPLPDGFASLESSLATLGAAFAWGDVGAVLADGERSAELEGPGSPWRPVITWALGWAHYCNGDLDKAARWFEETAAIAPEADQWVVGVGSIADLSLIAGMRGERAAQQRLAADAYELTRAHGLLDAIEDGEVHTAMGVALGAHGRHREALAELERGVFLRRLWGQKLDLADGLIALAAGHGALGDRAGEAAALDEAEVVLAVCADPGALPARLAHARRESRVAAARGAELSDRERTVLRMLSGGLSEREIGQELFVSFHTVHSHVKAVYRKLGVSSRAEAVALARRENLT